MNARNAISLLICLAALSQAKIRAFDPMNNTGFKVEPAMQNYNNEELVDMYNKDSLVALTDKKDDVDRPEQYRYTNETFNTRYQFQGTPGFDYAMNSLFFVRKPAGNAMYVFNAAKDKETEYPLGLDATINKIVLSQDILNRAFIAHNKGVTIVDFNDGLSRKDVSHRPTKKIVELLNPNRILLFCADDFNSDHSVTSVDVRSLKMQGLSVFARLGCANKNGLMLALANINHSNDIHFYHANDLEKPIKKVLIAEGNGVFYTYHMAFAQNDTRLVTVNGDGGSEVNVFDIEKQHKLFNVNLGTRISNLVIPDNTIIPYIALFKTEKDTSKEGEWTGLLKNDSNDNK
jgi:hypothetical protein